MSDTTSAPADPAAMARLLLGATLNPPPVTMPDYTGPSSHEGRGILSLLGEELGGGQQYGSTAEREQAGLSAAQAAGMRMLMASDYSMQPHTLGSIIGQGMAGAGESLARSQSVSAGERAMVQNQQLAAQQAQLERIKAALPLLTLQQKMQAIQGLPTTLGGNTPNTSIGAAGGSADVPAEYLPYFQEASQKTGIPVALLIAQAKQESGFNANATGGAGEVGIMQILPATARNPGGGMTGVDPKDLRDPRTNIMFGAQYLAARMPKGASANDPAAVEAALKAYNGGGDPNYVKNVLRYVPGAQAGVAKASAPPPPATAPGTPTVAPAGRATLPPPEPALAGTVQAAGPAAPTGTVIPPSPPGSAAAVDAIKAGMVGAGADPTTLAPGPGSAPAPGATVVAGTPTGPSPDSYEAYQLAHPIAPPSSDQQRLFNAQPDADQLRQIAEQKKNAELLYQQARGGADPAAAAKAREDYNGILDKENTLRENARKLAVEQQARWIEQQDKQRFDAWTKERDDARKQADTATAAKNRLDEIAATGEQTRQTALAGTENSYVLDERKRFGTERDGARAALDNLQSLRALSDAAGTSMTLDNVPVGGGKTGRDLMVAMGLGTDAAQQHWGAQQAFQAAANQMILELRKGVALGGLSDRDMSFLQNMGPSLLQQPQTRASIIGLLEAAQVQKRTYIDTVEQLWDGGKGMTWGQAKRAADKQMPDLMRSTPKDYNQMGLSDKQQWFRENIEPGSVYRAPDGGLRVAPLRPPGSTP